MLVSYLKELKGLFDTRFLVAYWGPTFISLALAALGGVAAHWGVAAALAGWKALDPMLQGVWTLALLLAVTVLAYLLQAVSTPLVRLYEGYWPDWLAGLAAKGRRYHQVRRQRLRKNEDHYRDFYWGYPANKSVVRPTRLGNTLTAAEDYPRQMYGLDTTLWWPRLASLLPADVQQQIDAALTPMLALLNLSFLFALLAFAGGVALIADHLAGRPQPLWLFLLTLPGGWLVAWLCYRAADTQATAYGDQIRTAFDLHRHKVLEAMHITRPTNLRDERSLWRMLNHWLYYYNPPWAQGWPPDPAQMPAFDPFHYDTYKPPQPSRPPAPEQVELTIKGSPRIILRQEKKNDDKDD